MEVPNFEIIDPLMDDDSLRYVQSKKERSEVVMNWIQRLVVDNIRSNTIEIAPPIVSRVFQEPASIAPNHSPTCPSVNRHLFENAS